MGNCHLSFFEKDAGFSENEKKIYLQAFDILSRKMENYLSGRPSRIENILLVSPFLLSEEERKERINLRKAIISSEYAKFGDILRYCGIDGDYCENDDELLIYCYDLKNSGELQAEYELENMLPLGSKFRLIVSGSDWRYRENKNLSFKDIEAKNYTWEDLDNIIISAVRRKNNA